IFSREYKAATHAWCQPGSKATYMLQLLLPALREKKATFQDGSVALITPDGFTSLAVGGYRLSGGMIHSGPSKKTMVSLHFETTDPENTEVRFYQATYQVEPSLFGGMMPEKKN